MQVKPGDLVKLGAKRTATVLGLGLVLRVAYARVEPNGSGEQMAEVLWAKYPGDGPQWYQAKNLLVASSPEEV